MKNLITRLNDLPSKTSGVHMTELVPSRALAIFAHPDDAEFLIGGTIAQWTARGCEVTYVICTNGNAGSDEPDMTCERLVEIRRDEQLAACQILGVKHLVFLGHNDCELEPDLGLRRELVHAVREYRPDVVICEDPAPIVYDDDFLPGGENINHPDHRAAGLAAIDATFPCASLRLLWPDQGGPHQAQALYLRGARPNLFIDISQTLPLKLAALQQHVSQLDGWDPTALVTDWSRWEGKQADLEAAEGFRVIPIS